MKNASAVTRCLCCIEVVTRRRGISADATELSLSPSVLCMRGTRARARAHTCACPTGGSRTPDTFIDERRGSASSRRDGTDCACELKISHESFAWFSFSLSLALSLSSLPLSLSSHNSPAERGTDKHVYAPGRFISHLNKGRSGSG